LYIDIAQHLPYNLLNAESVNIEKEKWR